jgi:anti-sigma factor (TIGR02949 family)
MRRQEEYNSETQPFVPHLMSTFDFYSCEEAVKRLNDYLDHELTPEEREDVIKHLQICKPCLEKFSFEENLISSIKLKVTELSAPKELIVKLSSLIRKE